MQSLKNILVTTTENIEGLEILQYVKPISAHIVAGTGFFSDFAASFSDIFGGRSQSYQKQLSSIYNEAIEALKKSAYENGANCIVGLRVDLDEISGKGKSMFMITALGTAVIIESPKKKNIQVRENSTAMSVEKMIEQRQRFSLIKKTQNNNLVLDDATWEFITENNVYEIAKEVYLRAVSIYPQITYEESKESLYQKLLNYLFTIPEEIRIPLLYEQLIENDTVFINGKFFNLIKDLRAIDHVRLESYLNGDNSEIRAKALQVITYDKEFYSQEDIKTYQRYIDLVQKNFSKYETIMQKKMLSSKEVEMWKCIFGEKNELQVKLCQNCGRDIYGFLAKEINPEVAIEKLTETIEILKNHTHTM